MRSTSAVIVGLLLVVGLAPTAAASPMARLQLVGPETVAVNASPTLVTLDLVLTLADFHCTRDEAYAVALSLREEGVNASLTPAAATFLVPAGSYAFVAYEANVTANVTITSATSGTLRVDAMFHSDGGDCIAPGGFPMATASWSANVTGTQRPPTGPSPTPTTRPTPTGPTPAPPAPTQEPPEQPTPTEEEPVTNASTGSNETGQPTNGRVDRLPPGGGYIGDYEPQESSKATPGIGVILAAVAVAVAALLLRKR